MPGPPWRRRNGQTAAINYRRVFSATQTGHQPDLNGVDEILAGLLEAGPLRQAARQIGRLGHDHIKLLPLFIDRILEYLSDVLR
jgi:hypothetical protein